MTNSVQLGFWTMRGMKAGSMRQSLVAFACWAAMSVSHAQQVGDQRECAAYTAQKGYSADYIELKVGKRQRGSPSAWRGNVEPVDVQVGDIVISYLRDKGRAMRAAYVEEVLRGADGKASAVVVSEWIEGKYVDERCFVTDHFGRLSPLQRLPLDGIEYMWPG